MQQFGPEVLNPHVTMGEAVSFLRNKTARRWKGTRQTPNSPSLHKLSFLFSYKIGYGQVLLSTPGNSCASIKKHLGQTKIRQQTTVSILINS